MNHERYIAIPKQVIIFPHEWLSRRGERKIHHERRSREWWIFVLPQLLSHDRMGKNCDTHGNCNVPWVMNSEFFPSQILKMIGFTFLVEKWHFRMLALTYITRKYPLWIEINPIKKFTFPQDWTHFRWKVHFSPGLNSLPMKSSLFPGIEIIPREKFEMIS